MKQKRIESVMLLYISGERERIKRLNKEKRQRKNKIMTGKKYFNNRRHIRQ